MALIKNPPGHLCGHQFGHLKNLKGITLPHSGISEHILQVRLTNFRSKDKPKISLIYDIIQISRRYAD